MLSLLIGPLLAPRAFSRRPLSVDRHPPVMTYKANTRQAAAEEGPANATEAKNGIFSNRSVPNQRCGAQVSLSVRLLPGVCSQAREVMVKDETRHPLWATCTSGKAPPPSVYQKEFQDQLMPGQLLKGAPELEKKKMSDMGRMPSSETTSTRRPRSTGGAISPMTLNLNGQHGRGGL
jgi:hypothetical protein